MSRGKSRTLIPYGFLDLENWPRPDVQVLSKEEHKRYAQRREAVEMYAAGEPFQNIHVRTGKCDEEVRRLVTRCVTPDGCGGIFGFNALVSGTRVRSYTRRKKVVGSPGCGSAGYAGALQQLFERLPDAAEYVEELLFKKRSEELVHEARIPYFAIHKAFKKRLRELGLTDNDWPFNTANYGYNALKNHCNDLRDRHLSKWIQARSGHDAARRSSVGNGYVSLLPVFRPFTHVQLDFHKVDASAIIVLRNDFGGELAVPVSRWHIGALVDEHSRAVLGVCIALETNPSGDAVLETIESVLRPDATLGTTIPNALIVDGKVLPNQLFPQLAYQGFTVLKVDNAWSNSATEVINNVIDTIGCAVNFGPVRAWWRRPLIERIFGELTRKGLQRLPSTYGTGTADTRRDNPNAQAIHNRIMLSDLTSVIFRCVREYNETVTEGLQFTSPIMALKSAMEHSASGFVHQSLPHASKSNLRLLMHVEECTVRGDLSKHVRPYIRSDRCRYTNSFLSNSYNLVGKKLIVYIDRRDVRSAWATVKETGEEIGALIPEKRWSMHGISLRDRKLINRSGLAQRLMDERADPVMDWSKQKKLDHINSRKSKSQKNKSSKDALVLARLSKVVSNAPQIEKTRPPQLDSTPSMPDPFGISEIPMVRSAGRRA